MKIVLINTDPMVAKLIEATAKKTGIPITSYASTDEVDSGALTQESFVFIDESAIGADNGRVKSIAQGFLSCLLYAKTKPMKEFAHVVKKPFLPTEILNILQAELLKLGQDLHNASDITKDQIAESSEMGAGSAGDHIGIESANSSTELNLKELDIKDLDFSALDKMDAGGLASSDSQEGLDLGDDLELDLPENPEDSQASKPNEQLDETLALDSSMAESMDSGELRVDLAESSTSAETTDADNIKTTNADEAIHFLDESDIEELDFGEIASENTSSQSGDHKTSADLDAIGTDGMADIIADNESSQAEQIATQAADETGDPHSAMAGDDGLDSALDLVDPVAKLDELEELGETDFTADLGGDTEENLRADLAGDSVDSPKDLQADSTHSLETLSDEDLAQTAILPQDEVELVKTLLEDSSMSLDETDEQEMSEQEASQTSDDISSNDVLGELESSVDSSSSAEAGANPLESSALEIENTQAQEVLLDNTESEQNLKQDENSAKDIAEEHFEEEHFADISLDDLAQVDSLADTQADHDMDTQAESTTKPSTDDTDDESSDFLQLSEKEICEVLGEEIPEDITNDVSIESSQDITEDIDKNTPQEPLEPESKTAESTDFGDSLESTEQEIAQEQEIGESAMQNDPTELPISTESLEAQAEKSTESSTDPMLDEMDIELDSTLTAAQSNQHTEAITDALDTETLDKQTQAESIDDLADLANLSSENPHEESKENVPTEDKSPESSLDIELDADLSPDPETSPNLLADEIDEPLSALDTQSISPDPTDDLSESLGSDLGEFGAGLQAINTLRDEMQALGDLDPFAASDITPHASMPNTSGAPALANRTQEELFSELLANKSAQEIRSLLNGAQISINISFADKQ